MYQDSSQITCKSVKSLMLVILTLLKCTTSHLIISFISPVIKHYCHTATGTAVNIVLCRHESWSLLGLIVMATVWLSTRLCNHAVCLAPRIAGGCLAPGAKANTSRTGHLINPGHHKRTETEGFQGCVYLHTLSTILKMRRGRYFFHKQSGLKQCSYSRFKLDVHSENT